MSQFQNEEKKELVQHSWDIGELYLRELLNVRIIFHNHTWKPVTLDYWIKGTNNKSIVKEP